MSDPEVVKQNATVVFGVETIVCTISNPHAFFEAYVQKRTAADKNAAGLWRLYVTPTGGVRTKVAESNVTNDSKPVRLSFSAVDMPAGNTYELCVYGLDSSSGSKNVTAVLVGYDYSAPNAQSSVNGTVGLPINQAEVVLATLNLEYQAVDISIDTSNLDGPATIIVYVTPSSGVRVPIFIRDFSGPVGKVYLGRIEDCSAPKYEVVGISRTGRAQGTVKADLTGSTPVAASGGGGPLPMGPDVTGLTNANAIKKVSSLALANSGIRNLAIDATGNVGAAGRPASWFDIRDYGALVTPTDIGPAVLAAAAAALAIGGGTVFIPPRDAGLQWGWTTSINIDCTNDRNISIIGVRGQTQIRIGLAQLSPLQLGNSNGMVSVENLIFTGDTGAGVNAPNVIDLQQARIGILQYCEFWGLECSATQYGVVRIVADTAYVSNCLFVGCNYTGTVNLGGCLSITGERDSCIVESCRFINNDNVFNGVTYNKASAALPNCWIWFGGQGPDTDPTAYGGVEVRQCYFEPGAPTAIGFLPQVASNFIIDHGIVRGCAFQQANTNPPILTNFCRNLTIEDCDFGNAQANQPSIGVGNANAVFVNRCNFKTGGKRIRFDAPVTFIEIFESEGYAFDTTVATPTNSLIQKNGVDSQIVFDPAQIFGCIGWWRADLGITLNVGNVARWNDQSGLQDPNRDFRQATAANQPPYNAIDAGYNNQSSIGPFDAVNDLLASAANWAVPADQAVIIAVFNTGGAATLEIFLQDNGFNDYEWFQNSSSTSLHWFISADVGVVVVDMQNIHTYAIDMNGAGTQIYQDGAVAGTINPGAAVAPTGLIIGGHAGALFGGKVTELIMYSDRTIALANLARVQAYLKARYGTP